MARWFTVFEYVVRQLSPAYKHALPWGGVQIIGTFTGACVCYSFFFWGPFLCSRLGGLAVGHGLAYLACMGDRLRVLVRLALWGFTVGGDPMPLGPVVRATEAAPPPPVYVCRTFRDSFLSRYGSLVFLLGSHRQSSAG